LPQETTSLHVRFIDFCLLNFFKCKKIEQTKVY